MAWREFFDLEIIQLISRHVSTGLISIAGILILGSAALLVTDPVLHPVIYWGETVVGGACTTRAVIIMLWELYAITRRRIREGGDSDGRISSILV